ncbi:MAG TPA: sigma-70 family RNA polymerase sigma factor [Phycisphaerae bacterium]|nr:sigma-70 family RNA polymerase sigma factor [Phycisphaerae bacterium]HRW51780.1 sigma-70 family RNA polymerase sigma factor [Phycisphaerae bacterium]
MSESDVTQMLAKVRAGDSSAAAALLPLVYEDLRAQAAVLFRAQNPEHTLQPTALVHEAYLKLVKSASNSWESRRHFMAVAATAMRQVLADHARDRRRLKRGGGAAKITLHDNYLTDQTAQIDLVELDDALAELSKLDPRQSRIVELRFLSGLNAEEIADLLGVSRRTVELDWRIARAWLRKRITETNS